MNMKRNGILVDTPAARVKRTKVNHRKQQTIKKYTKYSIWTKFENGTIAWTTTPHTFKFCRQLKKDGWEMKEVWELKQAIYEAQIS
ncbi:hypothetical protein ACQKMD_01330 [Viridibacillus sp. NPDC096237]|uniref:hypothetical protein n=1 Tax=Viridibacillus sp. NPDC096237 TaxID=3390721 RepID=UPI003D022491